MDTHNSARRTVMIVPSPASLNRMEVDRHAHASFTYAWTGRDWNLTSFRDFKPDARILRTSRYGQYAAQLIDEGLEYEVFHDEVNHVVSCAIVTAEMTSVLAPYTRGRTQYPDGISFCRMESYSGSSNENWLQVGQLSSDDPPIMIDAVQMDELSSRLAFAFEKVNRVRPPLSVS